MSGKIRVLRILEYRYDSVEQMDRDMARWTHGIAIGSDGWWSEKTTGMQMRSTSLHPEQLELGFDDG